VQVSEGRSARTLRQGCTSTNSLYECGCGTETAFVFQALQMKLDGLPNEPQDFLLGFAAAMQPGRSGTYAPKLSGPCSMTTM
jgi:hypothetical protein